MEEDPQSIYQLRVVLRDISPLVWRRILISNDSNFSDLHDVLLTLFDWDGSRLHNFRVHGKEIGSQGGDPEELTLRSLRLQPGERFLYEYNFSAGWQCDVRLESTHPRETKRRYPICNGGRGSSPLEIHSGPMEYLEALERQRFGPSLEEIDDLITLTEAFRGILDKPPSLTCQEFLEQPGVEEAAERLVENQDFLLQNFSRKPINKKLREQFEETKL